MDDTSVSRLPQSTNCHHFGTVDSHQVTLFTSSFCRTVEELTQTPILSFSHFPEFGSGRHAYLDCKQRNNFKPFHFTTASMEIDLLQSCLSISIPVEMDRCRRASKYACGARVLVRGQGFDNLAIFVVDMPLAENAAWLDLVADTEVEAGADSRYGAYSEGCENDSREAHAENCFQELWVKFRSVSMTRSVVL